MVINESNGFIINTKEIYIHDDVLLLLEFDRLDKKLRLKVKQSGYFDENEIYHCDGNKIYHIDFINVLGFEMSSCDFWGESERICSFSYLKPEERLLSSKLQQKINDTKNCKCSEIDFSEFIETLIQFISGDELRILCETILIE